jgi:DNA replication protein DnaC
VPKDFWNVKATDVTHNTDVFKNIVMKYTKNLNKALKHGYGLVFVGDNGVGKTFFISYVLMTAIRLGKTAYYTTMPQLDYDIKRGWGEKPVEERLRWMLTSDFVAIDEMGKEKFKSDAGGFIFTQIERILKQRCDNSLPTLLSTNMDFNTFVKSYGPTINSLITGKFQTVAMEPGDYRERMAKQMGDEMGYGK